MARTESISFQVHPLDEQSQINIMQQFHWNLLSSQEIKTVDNHMEQRGDSLYSVTNTEHYTKLTFSRDLDTPHLAEIRDLEAQNNALEPARYPKLFPVFPWWVWLLSTFVYGLGAVVWAAYFFLAYKPKKEAADALTAQNLRKRDEVMARLQQLD